METSSTTFRRASQDDLATIIKLLADDPLGAQRESYQLPLPQSYVDAFAAIERDPNNELTVAQLDGSVIGVLQITFIPYLTYQGGWRALIEGVRVASHLRSSGVGRELFNWAIERAKQRGCHLLQLTSDKARPSSVSTATLPTVEKTAPDWAMMVPTMVPPPAALMVAELPTRQNMFPACAPPARMMLRGAPAAPTVSVLAAWKIQTALGLPPASRVRSDPVIKNDVPVP